METHKICVYNYIRGTSFQLPYINSYAGESICQTGIDTTLSEEPQEARHRPKAQRGACKKITTREPHSRLLNKLQLSFDSLIISASPFSHKKNEPLLTAVPQLLLGGTQFLLTNSQGGADRGEEGDW